MEKAYENIKTDIEDRLDRVQLDTQNYIAKSQEDMLAKIAAMLSGNPSEKKGSVIIDPSAIKEEHKQSSGKAPMASEAPVMNQQVSYPESSLPGVTIYDGPSEYVVPDLNEIEKIRNEFPKMVEDRYKRSNFPDLTSSSEMRRSNEFKSCFTVRRAEASDKLQIPSNRQRSCFIVRDEKIDISSDLASSDEKINFYSDLASSSEMRRSTFLQILLHRQG
ncbi:hypothetical protein GQ457_02G037520 [Hibiscus cannabinus]